MKRPIDISCNTKHSLVHIGSLDSFDLTEGGIKAASNMLQYFETGNKSSLEEAVKIYNMLIPNENFGGEYTALLWICKYLLDSSSEFMEGFQYNPTVSSWYDYLSENGFEKLKMYIEYKYHFKTIPAMDIEKNLMLRYLEDFILFSNPDRERWEKTRKTLSKLRIRPGLTIADVGCGSGYFTFKLAHMVGPEGKVYGIEINPLHLDYLRKFAKKQNIQNVEIIESKADDIGLKKDIKADIVFSCSFFHVLYAVPRDEKRRPFIESIKNALHPNGALIIMDNDLLTDENMPYHGPYIAKDLLISQLYYYGFKLVKTVQIIKQRYALIFEQFDVSKMENKTDLAKGVISVMSGVSLVRYTLADADPELRFSEKGRNAAGLFLRALIDKTHENIDAAKAAYEEIIPTERIGEEYTAFSWICDYLKADGEYRAHMIVDALVKDYFDYLSENDFSLLKQYLLNQYELSRDEFQVDEAQPMDSEDLDQLSELIAFNNPARERWEKTSEMLACLDIKPGDVIGDVGCGHGYFTYRFANLAGPTGKVYATDTNKNVLSYVETIRDKYDLNIVPVVSALNDTKLPAGQFDKIFICSMYHAVYVGSIEFVKDAFVDSIKKALKDDGKLIIVDNEVTPLDDAPNYHSSGIDRRLLISQLGHYGFTLVDEKQFVPQRYILIFQKRA